MACPWFEPLLEAQAPDRPRPARAPLGVLHEGLCHASANAIKPAKHLLYQECNFGYGRENCPYFPQDSSADAVRFSGHGTDFVWVLEKDHAPVTHGRVSALDSSGLIALQAEAYRKYAG